MLSLKKIVRVLPAPVQSLLKRNYYLKVVRNYRPADWEWTSFVQPLIPSGSTVLDIGANVGYLSGLFARWVGPTGRVVSLEPIPATFDALSESMKKLYPERVTTIQSCVSDRTGTLTMAVPDYEGGGANYYESRIIDKPGNASNTYHVPATTLDVLVNNYQLNPAFIKIDVEGHERSVVNGGTDFFACHQPPVLIEVAGNPDDAESTAAVLFADLAKWGYVPHLIKNGKLVARSPGDKSVDYLFLAAV